jgi:hypothetical protein
VRVAIQCCAGSKTATQCEKNSSFVAAELKIPCVEGRKEGREEGREDAEGGICIHVHTQAQTNVYITHVIHVHIM